MKRYFILAVLLVSTAEASAQSPEVWQKLRSKYDIVWPYVDDGIIMVNRGGSYILRHLKMIY